MFKIQTVINLFNHIYKRYYNFTIEDYHSEKWFPILDINNIMVWHSIWWSLRNGSDLLGDGGHHNVILHNGYSRLTWVGACLKKTLHVKKILLHTYTLSQNQTLPWDNLLFTSTAWPPETCGPRERSNLAEVLHRDLLANPGRPRSATSLGRRRWSRSSLSFPLSLTVRQHCLAAAMYLYSYMVLCNIVMARIIVITFHVVYSGSLERTWL